MGSKISVLIILVVIIVLAGFAYEPPEQVRSIDTNSTYREVESADNTEVHEFEDYTVDSLYSGAPVEIQFDEDPLVKQYEQILKYNIAAVGVNFAGKYNITTWQCGENCQQSTITNIKNGKVVAHAVLSESGIAYSPDSRLLVVNPVAEHETSIGVVTDYYLLDERLDDLELVSKEVNGDEVLSDCIRAITIAENPITYEQMEFQTPCHVPVLWDII